MNIQSRIVLQFLVVGFEASDTDNFLKKISDRKDSQENIWQLSLPEYDFEFEKFDGFYQKKEKEKSVKEICTQEGNIGKFQKPLIIIFKKPTSTDDRSYNFVQDLYECVKSNPACFFIETFGRAQKIDGTIPDFKFDSNIQDKLFSIDLDSDSNTIKQLVLYIANNLTNLNIQPDINMPFPSYNVQNLVATSEINISETSEKGVKYSSMIYRTYVLTSNSIKLYASNNNGQPSQIANFKFDESFTFFHPISLITNFDGTKLILTTQFNIYLIDSKYSKFNPEDILPDVNRIYPIEITLENTNIRHILSIQFLPLFPDHIVIASSNNQAEYCISIYKINESGRNPKLDLVTNVGKPTKGQIKSFNLVPYSSQMSLSSYLRMFYLVQSGSNKQDNIELRSILPNLDIHFPENIEIPEIFRSKELISSVPKDDLMSRIKKNYKDSISKKTIPELIKVPGNKNPPPKQLVQSILYYYYCLAEGKDLKPYENYNYLKPINEENDKLANQLYSAEQIYKFYAEYSDEKTQKFSILEIFFLKDIFNKFKNSIDENIKKDFTPDMINQMEDGINQLFYSIPFEFDKMWFNHPSGTIISIRYEIDDQTYVIIDYDYSSKIEVTPNNSESSKIELTPNNMKDKDYIINDFSFAGNEIVGYMLAQKEKKERKFIHGKLTGSGTLKFDDCKLQKLNSVDQSFILSSDDNFERFYRAGDLFIKTKKSLFLVHNSKTPELLIWKLIESEQIIGFTSQPLFCIIAPGFTVTFSYKFTFTRVNPSQIYEEKILNDLGIRQRHKQLKSLEEKDNGPLGYDESLTKQSEETKKKGDELKEKAKKLKHDIDEFYNNVQKSIEDLHNMFPVYSNEEVSLLSMLNMESPNSTDSSSNDDDSA